MYRTGYWSSWQKASLMPGSRGGHIYMFMRMRMTIGSCSLPIDIMARYKGREDAYLR